jgi:SAM-dependent methyltransferase
MHVTGTSCWNRKRLLESDERRMERLMTRYQVHVDAPPGAIGESCRRTQCRICTDTRGTYFSANGFDWFHCYSCHTTQKILTYEQYENLNPTYDPGAFLDSLDREEIEQFLDVRDATKVLSDVISKYLGGTRKKTAQSRSFLDIGCGMGRYLVAAQRMGFDVMGFEPSTDHARVARATGRAWPMLKPVDHVSMIGSLAYDFFGLREIAEVHHSSSEYPFEFAAAAIAALRSSMPRSRRNSGAHAASTPRAEPPPLRRFGIKAKASRWGLTAVSAPIYAAGFAAGRQACLKSIVARKA